MEQSLIVHETHAAKYDYVATDETKMSFVAGDVIRVHQKASTGWWYGSVDGDRFGWFPSNYVEPFEEETDVGSTMDESFYIRCETVDGQVYHVHRFTGETYWENTPSTPKQEASVISPSSSQFTPSSYGRSHSIDHLDTGRSNSSNPSLNYTASTLPVNWSRIEGPEGQTLYYNTITKELQYSMPEGAGMEIKHALPPPTAIVRDAEEIPPNWGKKFTWDGRGYYFNYVTDLVVWDLTEVDPVSGNLLNDAINLPEADNRLTALVDITYPFPDSAWPHLTQEVTNALINLDVLARIGKKESYLNESANLMEAARMLLLSSRVSPAPKPIRLLVKTYHNNVMLSLAKVIKAAAVANGVWPPPDAQISLIQSCFEATTMVREFVLAVVAGGLNITQSDIERATESIKGSEDPDAADEIKKASNGEIAVNLKTRHAQIEVRVTDAIAALQQNAFATSKSTVISSIRLIMTDVGDFMSSVEDDIPLDILSSEISEEVRIRKDSLYNAVSSLQVAIAAASQRFAPANAVAEIVTAANWVNVAAMDLLVSSKFAIQEKEIFEEEKEGNTSQIETASINSGSRVGSEPVSPGPANSLLNLPERLSSLMNPMRNQHILNGHFDIDFSDHEDGAPPSPPVKFRTHSRLPLSLDVSNTGGLRRGSVEPHSAAPATAGTATSTGSSGKGTLPWYLRYDYKLTDIVVNSEGIIKGGTLEALVERMTLHDSSDSTYVQSFLLTYRSFTTTYDLFVLLQHRYLIVPPAELSPEEVEDWIKNKRDFVRLRVYNVMKSWVENYCYDNEEDRRVLKLMKHFAETVMMEETPNTAFQLSNLVDRREEYGVHMRVRTQQYNMRDVPGPILPWNLKRLKFLDLDPLEIARQLTLMESAAYIRIQPVECLKKAWSGKNDSPNVKAMITLSNQIAGWVIQSILSERDIKKRGALIKHFVNIADKCRSLNNFCTLQTILGALNSASIHRLKKTWAQIGKKNERLEALRDLMSLERNFAKYREAVHSSNPPCIPYFGLCLTDLTFIEDGSSDLLRVHFDRPQLHEEVRLTRPVTVNEGEFNHQTVMINFFKQIKTAEVIRDIQQFQNEPYHLAPVKEVQDFLRASFSDGFDDKELYNLSLELEPRDKDNEKVARMLVNTGFIEKSEV